MSDAHRSLTELFCPDHGHQRWTGDVKCADCGRVYLAAPGPIPDVCACKARLLPTVQGNRGPQWFGLAACPACAREQSLAALPLPSPQEEI